MAYTETMQCEGCNRVAKLEERVKHVGVTQDKMDKMIESLITLSVKFDETEKRSEKNSRILWGVLTMVIAQGVAFLFAFVRGL